MFSLLQARTQHDPGHMERGRPGRRLRLPGVHCRGGRGVHHRAGGRNAARMAPGNARHGRGPRCAGPPDRPAWPSAGPCAASRTSARDRGPAAAVRDGLASQGHSARGGHYSPARRGRHFRIGIGATGGAAGVAPRVAAMDRRARGLQGRPA